MGGHRLLVGTLLCATCINVIAGQALFVKEESLAQIRGTRSTSANTANFNNFSNAANGQNRSNRSNSTARRNNNRKSQSDFNNFNSNQNFNQQYNNNQQQANQFQQERYSQPPWEQPHFNHRGQQTRDRGNNQEDDFLKTSASQYPRQQYQQQVLSQSQNQKTPQNQKPQNQFFQKPNNQFNNNQFNNNQFNNHQSNNHQNDQDYDDQSNTQFINQFSVNSNGNNHRGQNQFRQNRQFQNSSNQRTPQQQTDSSQQNLNKQNNFSQRSNSNNFRQNNSQRFQQSNDFENQRQQNNGQFQNNGPQRIQSNVIPSNNAQQFQPRQTNQQRNNNRQSLQNPQNNQPNRRPQSQNQLQNNHQQNNHQLNNQQNNHQQNNQQRNLSSQRLQGQATTQTQTKLNLQQAPQNLRNSRIPSQPQNTVNIDQTVQSILNWIQGMSRAQERRARQQGAGQPSRQYLPVPEIDIPTERPRPFQPPPDSGTPAPTTAPPPPPTEPARQQVSQPSREYLPVPEEPATEAPRPFETPAPEGPGPAPETPGPAPETPAPEAPVTEGPIETPGPAPETPAVTEPAPVPTEGPTEGPTPAPEQPQAPEEPTAPEAPETEAPATPAPQTPAPEIPTEAPTAPPAQPEAPATVTEAPEGPEPTEPAPTGPAPAQPGDNELHPPHIHSIDVQCAKDMMTINLEFDRPYDGIIYSKGYFKDANCRYVQPNSGQTKFTFTVMLNSCGTQFVDDFTNSNQAYLENVIVLQNEEGIQEVWDSIRSVRCLWEGNLKQALTVALSVGSLNQEIVTFGGDTGMARLDIQMGRGPFAPAANGLVKIGEMMTLVVSVEGDPGFDVQVRACAARDADSTNLVQLTDDNGCVLKPKLLGAFQKTRETGNSGASIIAYAFFQAFKFPDVMDLIIECSVDLCKNDCEMCPNPNQKLEPGKRRRRDTWLADASNYTVHDDSGDLGVVMGRKLRVFTPDELPADVLVDLQDSLVNSTSQTYGDALLSVSNAPHLVCMSAPNFTLSAAVLLSVLAASCIASFLLWFKLQRAQFKANILRPQ